MDWKLKASLEADTRNIQSGLRSTSGWLRTTGREVDDLERKLIRLGQNVDIDVGLDGLTKADRALGRLAAQAEKLDRADPTLTVDTTDLTRAAGRVDALDQDLDGLFGAVHIDESEISDAAREAVSLDRRLDRLEGRVVVDDSEIGAAKREAGELDHRLDRVEGKVRMDRSELKSTSDDLVSLKALMRGLAIGGAVTIGGGAALGIGGLMASDDMTQTSIAFEGLLGDIELADALLTDLKKSAAKTPFEIDGLATSAQQLLGMGRAVDQVIPDMETIGGVAAALGRTDEDINGVVIALGQMSSKGKVSAEELNQISERLPGFNARAAIAAHRGTDVATAMKDMEDGTVGADDGIEAILAGMAQFPGAAGAMARQSETLSGKLSTFKDETRFALADAFEPLEQAAKDSIDRASSVVASDLPGLAASAGVMLEPLAETMLDFAGPAAQGIGSLFEGFGDGIAAARPQLQDLAGLLPEIGETAGDLVETTIPAAVEAFKLVAPIVTPGTLALRSLLKVVEALPGPMQGAVLSVGLLAKAGGPGGSSSALKWLAGTGTNTFGGGLQALALRTDHLAIKGGANLERFGAAGARAGGAVAGAGAKMGGAMRTLGSVPGAGLIAVGALALVANEWAKAAEEAAQYKALVDAITSDVEGSLSSGTAVSPRKLMDEALDSSGWAEELSSGSVGKALAAAGMTRTDIVDTLVDGTKEDVAKLGRTLATEDRNAQSNWSKFWEGVSGQATESGQAGRVSSPFGDLVPAMDEVLATLRTKSRESAQIIDETKQALGGDATSVEVMSELTRRVEGGSLALDELGGVTRYTGESIEELSRKTGVSAEQLKAMTDAERETLATSTELSGIMGAANTVLNETTGAWKGSGETTRAYFDILSDGQVTQGEASRLMNEFGLTAEGTEDALKGTAEAWASAIQTLAEQVPTMGTAWESVQAKSSEAIDAFKAANEGIDDSDGSFARTIENMQLSADTFNVQNVLDEMHRMTEDLLAERGNTTLLLESGYENLVAQVQSLPAEHRGMAVRQLLEMPPEQLKAAEERVQADFGRLGTAGAAMMVGGFAESLTLADPVMQQAAIISATMEAVAEGVPTPIMRMNADPLMSAAEAVSATMDDLSTRRAVARVDAETDAAAREIDNAARDRQAKITVTTVGVPSWGRGTGTGFADWGKGVGPFAGASGTGAGRPRAKGGVEKGQGDGLYRWAEQETGAELLVPQKGISQDRARKLLAIGAAWHGIEIPAAATGGVFGGGNPQAFMPGNGGPSTTTVNFGTSPSKTADDEFSWAKFVQERNQIAADSKEQLARTKVFLAKGYDHLIAEISTLPADQQGEALRQLADLPPDEQARLNKKIKKDYAELGTSAAEVMMGGYGDALDLVDPVRRGMDDVTRYIDAATRQAGEQLQRWTEGSIARWVGAGTDSAKKAGAAGGGPAGGFTGGTPGSSGLASAPGIGGMDPGDGKLDVADLLAQRSKAAAQSVRDMEGARTLLAKGMDDLVGQVSTLPPDQQGKAIKQLLALPPSELSRLQSQAKADSERIGRTGAQMMSDGYESALDLVDPVKLELDMLDAMYKANAAGVPTPQMNLDINPAWNKAQAITATLNHVAEAERVAELQADADQALWKAAEADYKLDEAARDRETTLTADGSQAMGEAGQVGAAADSAVAYRDPLLITADTSQAVQQLTVLHSALTQFSAAGAAAGLGVGQIAQMAGTAYRIGGFADGGVFDSDRPEGLYRFAERSTGGELLIPRKGISQDRALDLLAIGAQWHGAPGFAAGGTPGWSMPSRPVGGTAAGVNVRLGGITVPITVTPAPGEDIGQAVEKAFDEAGVQRKITETVRAAVRG